MRRRRRTDEARDVRDRFDDEEELTPHQLGALASIYERARDAIESGEEPAPVLAYIAGRADGALGHLRT